MLSKKESHSWKNDVTERRMIYISLCSHRGHSSAPDKARNSRLLRQYGITALQYDRLLAFYDSGCWICGWKPKKRRLAVDHCHKSGRVRGILCHMCNRGLRSFKDAPELHALHNTWRRIRRRKSCAANNHSASHLRECNM